MIEEAILAIGTRAFERTLFESLQGELAIRQLVIHRFDSEGAHALAVETLTSHAAGHGPPQVDQYVQSFYLRDPNRALLTPSAAPCTLLCNVDARDIEDREYRTRLFAAVGFAGKLSVIMRRPDHVLSVTLYRGNDVGPFSPGDSHRIETIQGYLAAAVQRHFRVKSSDVPLTTRLKHAVMTLGEKPLSQREALICAYILGGYSSEAISLNLDLSFHSVITYRRRAYAKLGVTSQSELFARVLGALSFEDIDEAPASPRKALSN